MPWLWVIFLLGGLYIVVKTVQGIMDFAVWLNESREMAKAQEAWKEKRRKEGGKGTGPPDSVKVRTERKSPHLDGTP